MLKKIKTKNDIPIWTKNLGDEFVKDIMQFFKNTNKQEINSILAGNLKEEYNILDFAPRFEKELIQDIFENEECCKYMERKVPQKNLRLAIKEFWINLQKKHEFNPFHNHYGLWSFNIIVKIPFNSKEEHDKSPGFRGNNNLAGCLQFIYNTPENDLKTFNILMDKTLEGTLILFPSDLFHQVYPFYTSNDLRITAAGNIYVT